MDITIKNLDFCYQWQHILKNISLKIHEREFFVILGPNGSGKTTLLRSLSGVFKPQEKKVYLGLKDLALMNARQIAHSLAAIEPEIKPSFEYSVKEIVSLGRIVHRGIDRIKHERMVEEALIQTNMIKAIDKSIFALSSGERQRVWLAMALAQQPKILILDEPTSHLDIKYQLEVLSLVKKLSQNITVVATIHDINLAVRYASRLALVKNGEVRFVGTPHEIITAEILQEIFEVEVQIIKDDQKFIAIIPKLGSA